MAATILKPVRKVLGIGGKKKAATEAAPAEQKGPIIKQLGPEADPRRRRRLGGLPGQIGSILSDKLG